MHGRCIMFWIGNVRVCASFSYLCRSTECNIFRRVTKPLLYIHSQASFVVTKLFHSTTCTTLEVHIFFINLDLKIDLPTCHTYIAIIFDDIFVQFFLEIPLDHNAIKHFLLSYLHRKYDLTCMYRGFKALFYSRACKGGYRPRLHRFREVLRCLSMSEKNITALTKYSMQGD